MTDYKTVLWDAAGPYWIDQANGKKTYIPPATAMQTTTDPKLVAWGKNNQAPDGGFLHSRGQWNSDTGKWDQPINWGNLMSAGIGGAIAAPAVVGLIGGGAGAAGAGGTAAATTGGVAGTAGTVGGGGIAAAAPSLASRLLTSPSLWGTVASTIGGIYSAKQQINANNDAARLSADATKYASDAQTKASEAAEKFLREQAQYGYTASEAANKANYGQFLAREHRLASVGNLLGAGPRETPDYVPQPDPHFTGSVGSDLAGVKSAGSGQTPSAFLKGLLDSGMDAQKAAEQTNAKFNLQTGSQAQYYAPSPNTSGKAVIGLPDSYISQEPNGWSLTVRGNNTAPTAQRLVYQPYVGTSVGNLLSRPPLPPTLAQRGY